MKEKAGSAFSVSKVCEKPCTTEFIFYLAGRGPKRTNSLTFTAHLFFSTSDRNEIPNATLTLYCKMVTFLTMQKGPILITTACSRATHMRQ